jgi:hypothetical protein
VRETAFVELVVVLPIAVLPPIAMAIWRRWSPAAVALWLASLALLVLWFVAAWRAFDRADAGLETGSILAGWGWVVAAAAAAACSVLVTGRAGVMTSRRPAHARSSATARGRPDQHVARRLTVPTTEEPAGTGS